jgi:hypothetical protein
VKKLVGKNKKLVKREPSEDLPERYELAKKIVRRAEEKAPSTVAGAVVGVLIGAAFGGPIGGIFGATVGSIWGAIKDDESKY